MTIKSRLNELNKFLEDLATEMWPGTIMQFYKRFDFQNISRISSFTIFILIFAIALLLCTRPAGIITKLEYFFVPNFSANTISRFRFSSGYLSSETGSNITPIQPTSVVFRNDWLFVSNWGANNISSHEVLESGLIQKTIVDLQSLSLSRPHHLLLHPNLPILYVAHESTPGYVTTWRIETNGSLKMLGNPLPAGDRTSTIVPTTDFSHIYASSPGDGKIYPFSIASDGWLTSITAEQIAFGISGPYMAIPILENKRIVVMNFATDNLLIFHRNQLTGKFGSQIAEIQLEKDSNPRWMAYLEKYNRILVASSAKSAIYSVDISENIILIGETISNLSNPRSISISPDGNFALCSIDQKILVLAMLSGRLLSIQEIQTGQLPLFGSFAVK